MSQCKGFTENNIQCKLQGASVRDNGYCYKHQNQAAVQLSVAMNNLKNFFTNDNQTTQMLNQCISMLDGKSLNDIPNFQNSVIDVLVRARGLENNSINSTLSALITEIDELSKNTSSYVTDSLRIIQDSRFLRDQDESLNKKSSELFQEIGDKLVELEKITAPVEHTIEELNNTLNNIMFQKDLTEKTRLQLENEINKTNSISSNITDARTKQLAEIENELSVYKSLHANMLGRETFINESLKDLESNTHQIRTQLTELKADYTRKLQEIQQHYAATMSAGGTVASDREQALMYENDNLQRELEDAVSQLQELKDMVSDRLLPSSDLAQQYYTVSTQLKTANEEKAALTRERDELKQQHALLELTIHDKVSSQNAQIEKHNAKLQRELQKCSEKIAIKQSEITEITEHQNMLESEAQLKIKQLQQQIHSNKLELERYKDDIEKQKLNSKSVAANEQFKKEILKSKMEMELKERSRNIRQEYDGKLKEMQKRHDENILQTEQQKREMRQTKSRLKQLEESIKYQQRALDQEKSVLQKKTDEFRSNSAMLESAIQESREKSTQLISLEKLYKEQINDLKQSMTADRNRLSQEISVLKQELQRVNQSSRSVSNSLQQCEIARDAIVMKAQQKASEYDKLHQEFMEQKTALQIMQNRHKNEMAQVLQQASRLKAYAAQSSDALTKCSRVHEDIKIREDALKEERRQMDRNLRENRLSQAAVERLMSEHELSKNRVVELESTVKACANTRRQIEADLKSLSSQLVDLKAANSTLTNQLRDNATAYERQLNERDMFAIRQHNKHIADENNLISKLSSTEKENKELRQDVLKSEKRIVATENILINTEAQHQDQLLDLINSRR